MQRIYIISIIISIQKNNNNNRRPEGRVSINQGIHGNKITPKKFGFTRIAFENVNSLGVGAKSQFNNEFRKVTRIKQLARQLELDILGHAETRANWPLLHHHRQLSQLFQSDTQLRTVTGHNSHEQYSTTQEGGTSLMAFDEIATKVTSTSSDETGLGRWCSMLFEGKEGYKCRVITAYQPCKQPKNGHYSTTYNQHRRYFRKRKVKTCPRELFRVHLLKDLTSWQQNEEKLILLMDANECLETGPLAKDLASIGMHDAIKTRTNLKGPATFQSGSKQIDGVWMSNDLLAQSASFLPLFVGVGDHRMALVDIPNEMLLGTSLQKISRATARRLQNKLPKSQSKYQDLLSKYVLQSLKFSSNVYLN